MDLEVAKNINAKRCIIILYDNPDKVISSN